MIGLNYLAHAYLFQGNPDIRFGNLIADFVKGRQINSYNPLVQEGIRIHRFIDVFTDKHPLIHQAVDFFKPHYRFSGPVFVDILLDHFLANDLTRFENETLMEFTRYVYLMIQERTHLLNEEMTKFFGYMEEYNWLYHYKNREGIEKSIRGICKRHPVLGEADPALDIFESRFDDLKAIYHVFFPVLHEEVRKKFQTQ